MGATVKAILRKDKKKSDGTCPINVRITVSRQTRQVGTKIYVTEGQWNQKKGLVRASHDLAEAYNVRIQELLNTAREQGLKAVSAEEVQRFLKKGSGSILTDLDDYIEGLKLRKQHWEGKHFSVLHGKLETCFGARLIWEQMDHRSLVKFEQHLREEDGNKNNTIRNHLNRLSRLFKHQLEKGQVSIDQDPFRGYTWPKAVPPDKRKLSRVEIEALEALRYPLRNPKRLARDVFLFSIYGGGIRFGDICCLTNDNLIDNRIVYRMMKTGQQVSMKLPERALTLIKDYQRVADPYLFGFLRAAYTGDPVGLRDRISNRNASVNRDLKKVAKDAGIEPQGFSMHIARHSFADLARTTTGDLHTISKALGHSSLKITETYLKSFDQEAVDGLSDAMWE
ncbi:site-specific integrase [Rhodothermus sp. AH-315-K08]|nr:site-specific integrase [Rhodothermus sp. AH-315-K08]